jgi:hypothetical protein
MPATIPAIERLSSEWGALGRSAPAVRALHAVAARDVGLHALVDGAEPAVPAPCPTPWDLVEFMRTARGRTQREEAAGVVRVLLREAGADPLISRFLVQALIPGMLTIAVRLRWGQGGEWEDGNAFFTELISTTWEVVADWSGQDRPFAVLDLLSAARCRIRRQLFRDRDLKRREAHLTPEVTADRTTRTETELEQLTRRLLALRQDGMRADEVEVMYAHHVLGFSIAELAQVTGRDRRVLYARRDRAYRRLCA